MVLGSESNTKKRKRVADFDLNVEAAPVEDHDESQENRTENVSMCRIKDDLRTCVTLQCGHKFHLDCIAKEFNEKKEMKCPNCGHVEESRWFSPNPKIGSKSESESDGLCPFERNSCLISPPDNNSEANAMTYESDSDSDSDSGEDSFVVLV